MVGTFSALGMLLLLLVTAILAGPGSCRGEWCPCKPGSTLPEPAHGSGLPEYLATKVSCSVREAQMPESKVQHRDVPAGLEAFPLLQPQPAPKASRHTEREPGAQVGSQAGAGAAPRDSICV